MKIRPKNHHRFFQQRRAVKDQLLNLRIWGGSTKSWWPKNILKPLVFHQFQWQNSDWKAPYMAMLAGDDKPAGKGGESTGVFPIFRQSLTKLHGETIKPTWRTAVSTVSSETWIPSGKQTKNSGKIHHVSWENPRTKWAMFNSYVCLPDGNMIVPFDIQT